MKHQRLLVLAALLLALPGRAGAQESARDIIDRVDRILRGESSHGIATMEVVTENWERNVTMEIWSLGTDYSLIRVRAPKKEEGTATLKAEDDIWNYLPRVDRTIKIPASMMMGSWMGSHFTNDDLVKESRLIDDYDIEISFEGPRDGPEVWEFLLTPKAEAAVVWGRIEYQVRKDDLMPTWARYYDEDGNLKRTLDFGDYRSMGGRLVPAVMDMRPEDKPSERTTVRYSELEFNIDIDQSFFSLRNLRSGVR
ncbi:MAG: outer membrane lipoprotein-sorting protein [Gemmatimonadota bacterium]|nr:MAG: outer membrane lipoprotein-sorting protein [Gemmatimonadota bacterium]